MTIRKGTRFAPSRLVFDSRRGLVALFVTVVCGCRESAKPPISDPVLERGRQVYLQYCVGCHGEKGDGRGPAERFLDPKPRDFTRTAFKFRSTPLRYLPTDEDLLRTVSQGLAGTAMPSFRLLPVDERHAVVQYVKTFSERWQDPDEHQPALPLGGPPESVGTDDSIIDGQAVYRRAGCVDCHGTGGRGDGKAVSTLRDERGGPLRPRDFTREPAKGGSRPEDYFRAITAGLDGSPAPAPSTAMGGYFKALNDEDRWNLVSYVMALRKYRGELPESLRKIP